MKKLIEKFTSFGFTVEQAEQIVRALKSYRSEFGAEDWKDALAGDFMRAFYPWAENDAQEALLQQCRNNMDVHEFILSDDLKI